MQAAMNLRCSGGALLILPPRLGLAQTGLLWLLPCCKSMAMSILVMPSAGRSFRQRATERQPVKVRKLDSLYWMMECRQHQSLLRDVEVVMVNGLTPWGNTHFIPRGPMREPLSTLTRADIVVIHHADLVCEAQLETIARTVQDSGATCSVFFSKLAPSHIFEVHQPLQKLSLNALDGMITLCVSAIGCPDAFIRTVREIGPLNVDRLDFSDHHFFNGHDLELIQERVRQLVDQHNKETVVLVTEKDYDRDPDVLKMLGVKVWVLSSSLQIMPLKEQGEDELMRKLKDIITATRHVVQP
uniref:tetraacyldisaccharide 4'-kinase n=1 Tax=Hordeum vulgare subsp. vulgare TaxID=112509 RepID=M0XQE7_HORVV